MIWKIARKEFLLNVMTFKFTVSTVLCVVLVAIFVPVLADDYRQRLSQYDLHVAENEAKLRDVKAYRVLTPMVYRRPQVLSVFSQGLEKRLADSARIDFGTRPDFGHIPVLNAGPTEVNPYLSIFPAFDVVLIFKVVMSALALLVAYEVVSQEKEQGTLALTLANPVPRPRVLLAKLLAGLLTLAVPMTIAFMVALLLLIAHPLIALAGSDWMRIGGMYLASLLFVMAVYNAGLLFSCLTRSSALALVFALLFWILSLVVIPDASVYLARRLRPTESIDARDGRIAALREQFRREGRAQRATLPKSGMANCIEGPFGGRGHWYVLICDPTEAERWKQSAPLEISLNSKYAPKFRDIELSHLRSLLRQTSLAKALGRISPTCLYDNTMSALAGTNLADFGTWTQRVALYRENILAYIRNKTDNLRSPLFITQCTAADRRAYLESGWSDEVVKAVEKRTRPLNLADLPRFTYTTGIVAGLRRAAPDLFLLFVSNIVMFSLSFVAFLRYDVR